MTDIRDVIRLGIEAMREPPQELVMVLTRRWLKIRWDALAHDPDFPKHSLGYDAWIAAAERGEIFALGAKVVLGPDQLPT